MRNASNKLSKLQKFCTCHMRHERQAKINKRITDAEKESVYRQGKRAFEENVQRGYNPYRGSNLSLAISWWHGWDTAEEEMKSQQRRHDHQGLSPK